MKTIRVRRNRPSIPALALALMLTMLFVYAISLSARPEEEASDASARSLSNMEVRMPGMEVDFICSDRCADSLQARISAAQCAQNGGAGLILSDGSEYVVVREAASGSTQETTLRRHANGLTLQISGTTAEIAAISGAVDFLRAQAVETGALAAALEGGDTDAASICALLSVYQTQGRRCRDSLAAIETGPAVLQQLESAVLSCLERLDNAIEATSPGNLRLIHAAACAEWIGLLEGLVG